MDELPKIKTSFLTENYLKQKWQASRCNRLGTAAMCVRSTSGYNYPGPRFWNRCYKIRVLGPDFGSLSIPAWNVMKMHF